MYRGIPTIAVVVLTVISAILVVLEPYERGAVFEPPLLSPVLTTLFVSLGYSVVAYVAARSYFRKPAPIFLLLGSAQVSIAAGTFLSFLILSPPNFRITISNVGIFLSALLQITSAAVAYRNPEPRGSSGSPRAKLILSYAGVLALIFLTAIATLWGLLPVFFVQGVGGTPLRQAVLGSSIFLLSLASIILFVVYRQSHQAILYWYCLGLALLALSLVDGLFVRAIGDVLNWTSRITLYMSGVYFLLLVLTNLRLRQLPHP